jgi:hypothetical protein
MLTSIKKVTIALAVTVLTLAAAALLATLWRTSSPVEAECRREECKTVWICASKNDFRPGCHKEICRNVAVACPRP